MEIIYTFHQRSSHSFTPSSSLSSTFRRFINTLQIPSFHFTYNYFCNPVSKNIWSTGDQMFEELHVKIFRTPPPRESYVEWGFSNGKGGFNLACIRVFSLSWRNTNPRTVCVFYKNSVHTKPVLLNSHLLFFLVPWIPCIFVQLHLDPTKCTTKQEIWFNDTPEDDARLASKHVG
jgi:hypothetical protein